MTKPSITLKDGMFKVTGDVTFHTVMDLYRTSKKLFSGQNDWVCDFAEVGNCDSAGLALLVEWMQWAKQQKKTVRFLNIPRPVEAIAKASGFQF